MTTSPSSTRRGKQKRPVLDARLPGGLVNADIEQTGAVLSALGIVSPAGLFCQLDIDGYLNELERVLDLAAGNHWRLGELLSAASRVTKEQLEEALAEQKRTGSKLGDILVAGGAITQAECDVALEFQRRQAGRSQAASKLYLGNILVATGQITRTQLEDALRRQAKSGRRLGDELVAAGYVRKGQVQGALSLQRRLIATVLFIALALSGGQGVGAANAAPTPGAGAQTVKLNVIARVAAFFRLQVQHQAASISITQQDIERGYVEVPAASRFSVSTNSPGNYMIDFHPIGGLFRAVQINGLNQALELNGDGGTVIANAPQVGTMTHELGYRFLLRPDVDPGHYPWPLTLAVHPM